MLQSINNFIFGDLSKRKVIGLCSYLSAISILEVFAYIFHGVFSVTASRVWLITGAVCLLSIICYFTKVVISDFKAKEFLAPILVVLLIIFLCFITGDLSITDVNPDAAQQAAAGLNSFTTSDLNYTGKAFLGYPNRQYIITALPALFFGRNIVTLHLGFAIPFLLGILILYCGLRKWAVNLKINTNLAVLPLFALFAFRFVTEYYANFEQAIYPISYTMVVMGFFLLFLCKPDLANIMGLAWTGCMLSNSYTPALATLGLLLVFLALTVIALVKFPKSLPFPVKLPLLTAKAVLFTLINILIFFAATLLDKRQDRITQLRSDGNLLILSLESIFDFLTDRNAVFLGMFGIIVIVYLLAGLTLRLKLRDFILSLWVLGVFAVTNLLTGYTAYQPAWIMQRALIVIPVVITGITLTAFELLKKYPVKKNLGIVLGMAVVLSLIGYNNFQQKNQSFTYFNYVQPMKYLLQDLEDTAKEKGLNSQSEFNLVMYTNNKLIKDAADYCKFFFPNMKAYYPESGALPSELDSDLDTFIYWDDALTEGIPVQMEEEITGYDSRYDLYVTWYRGSIMK